MNTKFTIASVLLIMVQITLSQPTASQTVGKRPNIVIILADDMGYSDMGMFGSEIKTPNMDALAMNGTRFTNYYTHASCSPTRSMLLSGQDTHLNGLGAMDEWTAPNQMGKEGYEGHLSTNLVTMPQLLKDVGYHTYMVGKWHLGKAPDKIPAARGFERDFTLLDGMGSYWDMTNMTALNPTSVFTEDGKYLTKLPKNYYATKTYTDKLINFIDEGRKDGKPFFAYVSHQAPHDPYHLPKDWRNRHVGEYDKGWDMVRQDRMKKQKELGILPATAQLAERMWYVPDYSILAPASKAVVGKKMELYAGLVENLDYHIGRLVDHLKKIGEYENTIFIVFGDNGAEGNDLGAMIGGTPGTLNYLFFASKWSNNNPNAWGEPNSYVGYGAGWAQVSMTPFSQYKGMMAEGGIRNALVVSGPINKLPKGSINHGTMFVGDIMPTLLEVAGGKYPETFNGKAQPKLMGKSWLPVLNGQAASPRTDKDYIAWEVFGNRAVRQGDWKIRWEIKPLGKSDWELFNLSQDPAERNDLASQNPYKLREMLVLWDKYAKENNVIIPNRGPFEAMEDQLPQRFPVQEGYPPLINIKQFVPPAGMMAEPKEIKKN
ncbi:arylsulfatase [Flavobacterium nackdongense]|uniref:Arylsulfatase n=1 Tax=Flavobacterium nackdongense TaxID=2547394 RepID=A0A4P6Y7Q8_9FLAO|nr:arylsulfatase [Flavobacterium nackdongense]QBN17698.1 arylsulfatase [Flavobacterium nackdongense]